MPAPRRRLACLARHLSPGAGAAPIPIQSNPTDGLVGSWGGRKKKAGGLVRGRGRQAAPAGDDTTPVIIGVSRLTPRGSANGWSDTGGIPPSPLDLMTATALEAAEDAGVKDPEGFFKNEVSVVGCAGMYADLSDIYPNLPRSLANRLDVAAGAVCHQRGEGGDGAQGA